MDLVARIPALLYPFGLSALARIGGFSYAAWAA